MSITSAEALYERDATRIFIYHAAGRSHGPAKETNKANPKSRNAPSPAQYQPP